MFGDYDSATAFESAHLQWSEIDVLLVDVRLPDGDGVELAKRFQMSRKASAPVVVVSGRPTAELLGRISSNLSSPWAFLLKNSNGLANLRKAIDAVRNGLVMVDQQAHGALSVAGEVRTLSESELSVMQLVASGESNASVAKRLFVSEKSVERLLTSIYQKYELEGLSKVSNPRVLATLKFLGLAR